MSSEQRYRQLDLTSVGSGNLTTNYGCTPTTVATQGPRVGTYKNMTDWVTPGFRALSKEGIITNSPMNSKKCTFSSGQTGYEQQSNQLKPCIEMAGWKDTFSNYLNWKLGPMGFTPPAEHINLSSLHTTAAVMALSNVKNPSVQGLAFIKEINQTLALLKNPINAVTQLLKKRNITAKNATSAASSQTLAVNFGIKPLMHDIEGLLEALVQVASKRETARGYAAQTFVDNGYEKVLHVGGVSTSYYKETLTESAEIRTGVLYAFDGKSLADALGLSLRDLPAAAWEVLPWSFLVDWFSNVGKVISSVTAAVSNDFLAQWESVRIIQTVRRQVTRHTINSGWDWSVTTPCSDWDQCIYETYTRTPLELVTNVGFQLNFSLNRVPTVTALALLMQQLTKR